MKKLVVMILLALVLISSACANGDGETVTPSATVEQSEAPTATATPTPDFSGTDFSGNWHVSEIIDSNGMTVADAEKQNLGAGFILELLPDGTYFVYNQDGKVLGQGTYSVALNQLILTANSAETAYEIVDADTLRIIQPDTSITIMKREVIETAEGEDQIPEDDTGNAEGDSGDEPTEGTTPPPDPAATDNTEPTASAPAEGTPATTE